MIWLLHWDNNEEERRRIKEKEDRINEILEIKRRDCEKSEKEREKEKKVSFSVTKQVRIDWSTPSNEEKKDGDSSSNTRDCSEK